MMTPFLIFFLIFSVYPVLQAIFYSFTNYNVLEKADFIGLANYSKLFLKDTIFIKAIQNTFIIAVFVGPLGYILSFLLAWMINELPHWLGTILTVVFYAPSMAGNVVIIFGLIFSNDANGYLNGILLKLGIIDEAVLWLSESATILPIVIIVSLWMSLGVGFLSFVAGIKGVDEAQYEAAAIDGIRNRWQELWFITLPNMKPQLLFGAVMSITGALSVGGTADSLVGFPSPNYASHTIVNHLNDYGLIRLEMGRASAIAVILFFLMILCNLLIQKLLHKVGT
ncbi:multiple sugar transport system permease protein [Anaerotaenia torta]